MRFARWYPSATTLPNGEVLVSEGIDEAGRNVGTYEVWNPASNTWRSLDGAVRSLDYAYYPFMHVTLDGRVMKTGPLPDMAFLNTSGNGQWTSASTRDGTSRKYGSSVPFAPGKALVVGGGEVDGTATAMVVDLNTGNATATGSMRQARRNLNAVVLPTGAVLAVGGNGRKNDEGSLPLSAELWDPSTGQWSELAEMSVPRPYHSTALLLPDGRVFASGGYDAYKGASRYRNAEFFSPPYLFKRDGSGQLAARPVISSVPDSLNYAASVDVASPDATTVAKVALIRLGSTTHAFDFSQRYVPLEFNKGTGALRVTTPQNANLAPPGYYMLFVVNAAGVPSVARIVRLG